MQCVTKILWPENTQNVSINRFFERGRYHFLAGKQKGCHGISHVNAMVCPVKHGDTSSVSSKLERIFYFRRSALLRTSLWRSQGRALVLRLFGFYIDDFDVFRHARTHQAHSCLLSLHLQLVELAASARHFEMESSQLGRSELRPRSIKN